MQYYYLVDSFKHVLDSRALFVNCEAVGTVNPSIDHRDVLTHTEPVLMRARFGNPTHVDLWESSPGVTLLGDPLDNEEMADEHLQTLKRFHSFEQQGQNWVDTTTGKLLTKKPHVRKLMTDYVGKMFMGFRFRVYA